jgi:4-aminobutyrate aminotransferase/(S)-3-amino-2-methylpropionate transaminase
MERDHLAERSAEIGRVVKERFCAWKERYHVIGDVRGLGGMIGLEFVKDQKSKEPNAPFVAQLIQETVHRGLMIENAGTHGNVIRFLAPLTMTDAQLSAGLDILEASIKALL